MHIVIAGGSGFLGSALTSKLKADGHTVTVLSRRPGEGQIAWDPAAPSGAWIGVVAAADAVVNLAGDPIEAGRWTAARKASILNSRVAATRAIVQALAGASRPPVLVNGSAVGYYGAHGDEVLTEEAGAGHDFLAGVCVEWEAEAMRAADRARVVLLRTGLVLDRSDGALPKLSLPFKLFAGGPVGSGHQWWSWIHLDDWVSMTAWALVTGSVAGPINLTAPAPVTNRVFAAALGRSLRRPALLPAPGFALRLALGEMADALILNGQRVLPARAQALGFQFRFDTVEAALDDINRARS